MKYRLADVVMFMRGTNDVVAGHTTAEILAAYAMIIKDGEGGYTEYQDYRVSFRGELVHARPRAGEREDAANGAFRESRRYRLTPDVRQLGHCIHQQCDPGVGQGP